MSIMIVPRFFDLESEIQKEINEQLPPQGHENSPYETIRQRFELKAVQYSKERLKRLQSISKLVDELLPLLEAEAGAAPLCMLKEAHSLARAGTPEAEPGELMHIVSDMTANMRRYQSVVAYATTQHRSRLRTPDARALSEEIIGAWVKRKGLQQPRYSRDPVTGEAGGPLIRFILLMFKAAFGQERTTEQAAKDIDDFKKQNSL